MLDTSFYINIMNICSLINRMQLWICGCRCFDNLRCFADRLYAAAAATTAAATAAAATATAAATWG